MNTSTKKVLSFILSISIIFLFTAISFANQSGVSETNSLSEKEMEKLIENVASGDTLVGGGVPFESAYFQKTPKTSGEITPNWAGGGPNHTHQFIASNGILALRNDKGSAIVGHLYEDNGAAIIMEYADKPDVDEIDLPYICLGHFYDPTTGTNYRGTTNPTANQRFSDHYNAAVSSFSFNKTLAWQELGRAIHYVSDLNEPHHAANKLAGLTNHGDYENWVDANRANYIVTSCPTETYTYCMNNNAWVIGHSMAVNSHSYIDYALQSDEVNMNYAATNTLPKAQRVTAGIYYKFLKDVGEIQ